MVSEESFDREKIAVALSYNRKKDKAPTVSAKGKGLIAEQIIALAKQHNIEVRQDSDLALLLSKIDLDMPIPLEAYAAVAEMLAYVYKVNDQAKEENMNALPNDPERLFDDIAQFISESRLLLESGAVMELTGFDEQVRSLCDSVLQLSLEERIKYADRLQQLLGDLKALADTMVDQRDTVAEEMRGLSHHKKASVAYRIVEASDHFADKDNEEE